MSELRDWRFNEEGRKWFKVIMIDYDWALIGVL
jgi:hypothetical protein